MKTINLVAFALLLGTTSLFAQNKKESAPKGNVFVKIFSNFHTGLGSMNDYSGFELSRAYLGYKYKISDKLAGKVTMDIGNPKNGSSLERTAYVKHAMLTWKEGNLSVDFGLIETKLFKTQERFWGNRYLFKSFQDENKWGSSADMGISATYQFSKYLAADFILVNGEGYKKLQSDNNYRTGFGITYTPCENIILRAYYDNFTKDDNIDKLKDQNIIALFAGYNTNKFSIGAEYNMLYNYAFNNGNDLSGISAYIAYKASKKIKVFGRYDNLSSTSNWNKSEDGDQMITGIEYMPIKNLKIAPNYRMWLPKESTSNNQAILYLNVELVF